MGKVVNFEKASLNERMARVAEALGRVAGGVADPVERARLQQRARDVAARARVLPCE